MASLAVPRGAPDLSSIYVFPSIHLWTSLQRVLIGTLLFVLHNIASNILSLRLWFGWPVCVLLCSRSTHDCGCRKQQTCLCVCFEDQHCKAVWKPNFWTRSWRFLNGMGVPQYVMYVLQQCKCHSPRSDLQMQTHDVVHAFHGRWNGGFFRCHSVGGFLNPEVATEAATEVFSVLVCSCSVYILTRESMVAATVISMLHMPPKS